MSSNEKDNSRIMNVPLLFLLEDEESYAKLTKNCMGRYSLVDVDIGMERKFSLASSLSESTFASGESSQGEELRIGGWMQALESPRDSKVSPLVKNG